MQRTREEIIATRDEAWGMAKRAQDPVVMALASLTAVASAQLEVGLDTRDQNTEIISLLQKLVEKGNKTKVISTEVPMTAKEQELLDSIQA